MLRDLFTKNIGLKFMALALAIILWFISRYWMLK